VRNRRYHAAATVLTAALLMAIVVLETFRIA
jgi:hypothetical protein